MSQLTRWLPGIIRRRSRGVLRVLRRTANGRKFGGKQVVHFLHIGKTGGTAIKTALRPALPAGSFIIELHPHRFFLKDVPRGEKVIFFVRDPLSRFVSGFSSRKRQDLPRYIAPWSPAEGAAFRAFDTPNELATALSSRIRDRQMAAVSAMKGIQHVNSSYWDWFDTERYLLSRFPDVFFIGFQENLNDDFERLKELLGLPASITLPGDDSAAHRSPGGLDLHLCHEAVRNLKDWYADDYAFIKICRHWRTLHLL